MGASVRIEDEAFSDRRYDRLAAELGLADSDHARGKMAVIWRQCTLEQRHILDVADIVLVLGPKGPDALIAARLGERKGDKIRIKGTKGRIEWLKTLRRNGKFGKLGGRPKKNPDGFSDEPSKVSENTESETPPAPAPAPAHIESIPDGATVGSKERAVDPFKEQIDQVASHYAEVHPENHRQGRTPKGRRIIRARLAGDKYTVEQLCQAIDGNAADRWHIEHGKHELEYVLRNETQVDKFKALAGKPANGTAVRAAVTVNGRMFVGGQEILT